MNSKIHQIRHHDTNESAQVVAVSSGYSQSCKSSMALNLAICLANMHKKVCVFDSNETQPEQKLLFGRPSQLTLFDVMNGDIAIQDLMYQGPGGINVIPQSTGIVEYTRLMDMHRQNLLSAITQLQLDYDFILIDSAAGINVTTLSFILGSGHIVITVTPQASSLIDAFALLKGIKQRVFQQPVKVIVNLVAGELEAKQIIARLSITVRKYLGLQCGGLSFFIIDNEMLEVMSQTSLVTLQNGKSLPRQCLNNIALRLAETKVVETPATTSELAEVDPQVSIDVESTHEPIDDNPQWLNEAIYAVNNTALDELEPIMQKLNEIWQQRKQLLVEKKQHQNVYELELLKLKTAIHFASHVENKQAKGG